MTLSTFQTKVLAKIAVAVVGVVIVVLFLVSMGTPRDSILAKARADSAQAATTEGQCKAQAAASSTQSCPRARPVARTDSASGGAKLTCQGCNPLFDGWRLTIPRVRYVAACLFIALLLRLVQNVFRALAVQRGDFPYDKERNPSPVIEDFGRAFWYSFGGFNEFKEHSDLWLQYLINVFELAAYPVLLVLGQGLVIGAWLGIRTAGSWSGWGVSRTSFLRFLLVSLLVLSVSYFCLTPYIMRLPC